jgi:hypothetical protein
MRRWSRLLNGWVSATSQRWTDGTSTSFVPFMRTRSRSSRDLGALANVRPRPTAAYRPAMADTDPCFRRDGDLLLPHPALHSAWADNMLDGRYLCGLVAWGASAAVDDPALHPARITVDMFRPVIMEPLTVSHRVVRSGRRIVVVDVSVARDGVEMCRGSVAWLRRTPDGTEEPAEPGPWAPPDPTTVEPMRLTREIAYDLRLITTPGAPRPRSAWVRETRPFIDDEWASPFGRAAMAADITNFLTNTGPDGLTHVNADVTLTIGRLPAGDWIGLLSTTRAASDGVATAGADMYDQRGRIGQVLEIGLADPRHGQASRGSG